MSVQGDTCRVRSCARRAAYSGTLEAVLLGSLFAPMVLHSLPSFLTPAYLDPGTGSLIIQAAVGAIVAAGLALKVYWFKIKDFFGKSPR